MLYKVKMKIKLTLTTNFMDFFHRLMLKINPLSTKLYPSDLKIHFVQRSKHSLLRF